MHGLSYDLLLCERSRRHAESSAKDSHGSMNKYIKLALGTFISHVPGQREDLRGVDKNHKHTSQQ